MNKCIFLGRMTDDPEITYTQGEREMAIARFDFAVDRRGSREGEPTADFFRCTAFDRRAELLERFGRKGLKLLLTGKMQNNNYTNKEGIKVYSMQFLVDDVEFAERKGAGGEAGGEQGTAPENQAEPSAAPNRPVTRQPAASQSTTRQPAANRSAARQPAARTSTRQPARAASRSTSRGAQQSAPASNKDGFMNIDDGMDDGDLPFN